MTQINVITATAEELDAVPQIKGHRFEIVRHRNDRGKFSALRQLDGVPAMAENAYDLENFLAI